MFLTNLERIGRDHSSKSVLLDSTFIKKYKKDDSNYFGQVLWKTN